MRVPAARAQCGRVAVREKTGAARPAARESAAPSAAKTPVDGAEPGRHVRPALRRPWPRHGIETMNASPSSPTNPAASASPSASADVSHADMANAIRALAMDAVEAAKSGHPGMPMGMADVATVLFTEFLAFDPARPDWPDRDRFVLSAGHGSMLLYALLWLTGYEDVTLDQIRNFRQLGARTAGHPEYGAAAGIETTTGPLGQGLANAVGMALAERLLAARFGDAVVSHHTYALAGDGCLMEGISHEAISLAGHLGLGRLIVLFDDNKISIDGPTDLSVSDDQLARFAGLGLGRPGHRRPRPGGYPRSDFAGAKNRRAVVDRLPHHDRLWRAEKGRYVRVARRPSGRGRNFRRAGSAGLAFAAFRGARVHPGGLARRRLPRRRRPRSLGRTSRGAGVRRAGRVRPPDGRTAARRLGGRPRRIQARAGGRGAGPGDPGFLGQDPRGSVRRDPRAVRRLCRPDGFREHQDPGHASRGEGRFRRPLSVLRGARARDGGGDERPRPAPGRHPLCRHVSGLCRLCAPGDSPLAP